MRDGSTRLAAAVLVLAVVWIVVYWVTPAAQGPASVAFERPEETQPPPANPDPSTLPPRSALRGGRSGIPSDTVSSQPPRASPQPAPIPELRSPTDMVPRTGVIPPKFIDHAVQAGDSAERISQRYYGTASYWQQIMRANPRVDFQHLRAGLIIRIPEDPSNIQGIPVEIVSTHAPSNVSPVSSGESASRARGIEYRVVSGDTLGGIAQAMYGKSALWARIRDANRDQVNEEGTNIRPGMVLIIPPAPNEAQP